MKPRDLKAEDTLLQHGALAMRRHADASLDGTHRDPGIPEEWSYALLVMAGWVEHQRTVLNVESRAYALAACHSFIHGKDLVIP